MSLMKRAWAPAWSMLCLPGLALAHGDDHVTVASFFGPVLGLLAFMLVVSLGKAIIRRWQGA